MGRTPAGETRDGVFRFVREKLLGRIPPTCARSRPRSASGHRRARGSTSTGSSSRGGSSRSPARRGYRLPARAETGEIVVALVGDEATVKRLRVRGRLVELHAENPAFEPIVPDPRQFSLLGKVVEVRRYLEGR